MRFNNNKQRNKINKLIDDLQNYFMELLEEYQLDNSHLWIIAPEKLKEDELIKLCKYGIFANLENSFAITYSAFHVDEESEMNETFDDLSIVQWVDSYVCMLESVITCTLIDCNFDFDVSLQCLKFVVRHEIGHCIDHRNYVGKPLGEVRAFISESEQVHATKSRANASKKRKMENYIKYMNMKDEANANRFVGIEYADIYQFIDHITG